MILTKEKATFVDAFVDPTIHQGTLSADGKFVFHDQQWVPAQLSPDCNWYAYNNQWQPLNPNSAVLAKSIQSNDSSHINQKTPQSNGSLTPILCLLGMLAILWYVFDSGGRGLMGFQLFSWWDVANLDCDGYWGSVSDCNSEKNLALAHVFVSGVIFVYLLITLVMQTMTDDIDDRNDNTLIFTIIYFVFMIPLVFIFLGSIDV